MGSSTARSLHGVSSQRATLAHDSRLTVRGQCTVHEVSVPEVTIRPRAHGGQGPRVWGWAGGGGGDSWWWGTREPLSGAATRMLPTPLTADDCQPLLAAPPAAGRVAKADVFPHDWAVLGGPPWDGFGVSGD